MAIRYLLDTNIASYGIKGNFPHVRERLLKTPTPEIGISVITEAELRFGVERQGAPSHLRLAVEEFLVRVEILPWDSGAARRYAELRSALEGSGSPMSHFDLMIAAHALAVRVTLVTHDRVFGRVKGLKTEDWTKEN
ncbi:MAG TPA: type II toxin-antitoxin system VapC family toxin [Candidatus Binatia bacterium]|nr:type II toxin-antitoxin system VapC family toxin [Candidatus Binatia bacterium]